MAENEKALQATETQLNMSEKFTKKVLEEFGTTTTGELRITDYQRTLVQGYFINIDRAIKATEEARIRKNKSNSDHKYDNNLPVTWKSVNLSDLALDAVHYARMGLDMMQDNHLVPIPYKNKKTQKYDMNLMVGYGGKQYIAEKYALVKPTAVTIELVHTNDIFKPVKKNVNNKVESYEFEITSPFDRGAVVGGFGYIEFEDTTKNKLIIMTLKDIEKRKPKYAAPEFWGGLKTTWKNGQKVEENVEGWFEEMCLKTIKREVYSAKNIPRDPQKIDSEYQHMKMREARYAEMEAQSEIDSNANVTVIDTTPDKPQPLLDATIDEVPEEPEAVDIQDGEITGPTF